MSRNKTAPLPIQQTLCLTTDMPDPWDIPGMEWLAAVLGITKGGREWLTTEEAARSMGMTDAGVILLLNAGALEHWRAGTRKGGHYRITKRSVLCHVYSSWSHRDKATQPQITSLVLHLLTGLPNRFLLQIVQEAQRVAKERKQANKRLTESK